MSTDLGTDMITSVKELMNSFKQYKFRSIQFTPKG